MKVIIFIRSNGIFKLDVASSIREWGYQIAIVEKGFTNPNNIADYVIDTDTNSIDELITDIADFGQTHEIAAIMSFTEFGIEQAAVVSQVLGYPGPECAAIKRCRNKFLTRIATRQRNIPTPRFFVAKTVMDIKERFHEIGGSAIIKPLNFAGGCGVMKVDQSDDLEERFQILQNRRKSAPVMDFMEDTLGEHWLVEEYLEGFEISVESVTYQGETYVLVIHDKMCDVEEPYYVENFFVTPSSRITPQLEEKIVQMTKDVLAAVGYTSGLSHTEFRITKSGPVLVEINARQGGILVPESVYFSVGINLPKVAVQLMLGMEPELCMTERKPVVFHTITVPEGKVHSITGFEQVSELEGLQLVEQWLKVGDTVKARQANYGGGILASGEKIDNLILKVKEAVSLIQYETIAEEVV